MLGRLGYRSATSEVLRPKEHHLYCAIIGSLNWMVTLGQIDIAYATNTLARFSMEPRIGHLKAAFRVLGYLQAPQSDSIPIDHRPFDYSVLEQESNDLRIYWKEFYPDRDLTGTPSLPDSVPIPELTPELVLHRSKVRYPDSFPVHALS